VVIFDIKYQIPVFGDFKNGYVPASQPLDSVQGWQPMDA
jgi:hypothetical protein